MKIRADVSPQAKVTPVKYFRTFDQAQQERYWRTNLDEWDWDGESPRSRAVAYMMMVFDESIEFLPPAGFDAVWDAPTYDHTDWDMSDKEWRQLLDVCPWIDNTPSDTREGRIDPDGTAPLF